MPVSSPILLILCYIVLLLALSFSGFFFGRAIARDKAYFAPPYGMLYHLSVTLLFLLAAHLIPLRHAFTLLLPILVLVWLLAYTCRFREKLLATLVYWSGYEIITFLLQDLTHLISKTSHHEGHPNQPEAPTFATILGNALLGKCIAALVLLLLSVSLWRYYRKKANPLSQRNTIRFTVILAVSIGLLSAFLIATQYSADTFNPHTSFTVTMVVLFNVIIFLVLHHQSLMESRMEQTNYQLQLQ